MVVSRHEDQTHSAQFRLQFKGNIRGISPQNSYTIWLLPLTSATPTASFVKCNKLPTEKAEEKRSGQLVINPAGFDTPIPIATSN
jgi:hypothetical protein